MHVCTVCICMCVLVSFYRVCNGPEKRGVSDKECELYDHKTESTRLAVARQPVVHVVYSG